MSAEHGGHHSESESFTSIIVSLLLMFTLIPSVTEPVEDVVNGLWGASGGGHEGH